ncbi:GNAT family N-acetyltransferase [Paenibacillus mucilaginosus]|uniref:Acetyltransferase n=1 Tax=Paenibacillus mucilaginosus (strain KNP414) TaxID=1036673 RepID=F8FF94_PAEMK|nr:GNAT family N-acetyltransferase [Paenibacillus mucilaginosus]AEI41812.1 Acetyltransferase [Paenibacillus mucilaginosus KNP414]MCG7214493.1 GNAT family N-acetyltransferase [Paenibacillus mucilaginosus]WDM30775.1 GNAT family N-acetyltransferase [Paenibacillus mucilaginosus]
MNISLQKAVESDAELIFDMQVRAFLPLLQKYRDYDTSPANETVEQVRARISQPQSSYYHILTDGKPLGAIRVLWREEGRYWISPIFILPEYQGRGLAQRTIERIWELYPEAASWQLATLLEEARNCYLYEKMGFVRTGEQKRLNERATLVFYQKVCSS